MIVPKDDRSGSASDAGVPQFIDFTMTERPDKQTPMRGGLRWLDHEANLRFGKPFIDCAAADRTAILDDIAFPKKVKPELAQGAAFFSPLPRPRRERLLHQQDRDRRPAVLGNRPNQWNGCPPECLDHLGLKA